MALVSSLYGMGSVMVIVLDALRVQIKCPPAKCYIALMFSLYGMGRCKVQKNGYYVVDL